MKKKLIIAFICAFTLFIITGLLISMIYLYKQDKLNKQIKLIELYMNNNDYDTAKALIQPVIIDNSDNKKLREILDKIIAEEAKTKDNYAIGQIRLTEMLYDLLSENRTNNKDIINKINLIDRYTMIEQKKTVKSFNPEVEKLVDDAVNLYNAKNYADAKLKLKTALMIEEDNPYANAYYGAVLFEENPENSLNIEEASLKCNKAVNKDNTIDIAYYTLAKIYIKKGLTDEAVIKLNESIRINPENYKSFYELAKIYYLQNEFIKAEKYFLTALSVKKEFAECCYYLGEIYFNKEIYDKAALYYNRLIGYDKNYYKGYIRLAEISLKNGRVNDAIAYYLSVNNLEKNYKTSFELAGCYKLLGEYDRAVRYYKESLSLNCGANQEETGIKKMTCDGLLEIYNKQNNKKDAEDIVKMLNKI